MPVKKVLKKTNTPAQPDIDDDDRDDESDEVDEEDLNDNPDDVSDDETKTDEPTSASDTHGNTLPGAPRDGKAYRPDEPVIIRGKVRGNLVTVEEPVYRAVIGRGSSRWRFHLIAAAGAEMPLSRLKEIGKREDDKAAGTFEVDKNSL